MDWIIVAAAVTAGWMVLSVLTGERITRQNQLINAIAAAKTVADEKATASVK